jgi:class 3 adenylate cyclase/tetratricopeptide (TPR) repeat protein
MSDENRQSELLKPYVPRLVIEWLRETPDATVREVDGTLAFVDISGFTKMTERLARKGKVGAEEVSDTLDMCFTELLSVAYDYGAGLIKWGGDAVLLLFDGPGHAPRGARAAAGMQRTLRAMGKLRTSAGLVTLRMSIGIHSGTFHFFLAGDLHRELVIAGPAASATVDMESIADAGEVVLSPSTAALLDPSVVGKPKEEGFLLRGEPEVVVDRALPAPDVTGLDLTQCLPLGIREHLLSDAGDAEHRPIATAFIEFSGTDELLEREGPEALGAAIDETITLVQHAGHQHKVVFSETDIARAGGKILLIAGAPRTVGDEEERMLRAVRAIMDNRGRLPLRIGVNRGRVFSGDFGPPYRRTYSVKGDALNTAARIMGKAAPGEIFATEEILARSRTQFQTTPVGPFVLKGKAEPLPAFAVDVIAGRADSEQLAPFVGREAEMAVLEHGLACARAGTGCVVEVVGEPGIGKSRLVEEVRSRADGLAVIEAPCEQYEAMTAYFPVKRVLRTVLRLRDNELPARVEQRLRSRVEKAAPSLVPWLPLLGMLLDVELPATSETAQLDEEFRRQRLEEAAAELLTTLLAEPTLLVFEDAHWMDESSGGLLRRLADEAAGRPWLILTTRRDVDGGFVAPEGPQTRSIRPEPLGEREATALVQSATEELPFPPHVIAALTERSGGNPLFLTELITTAREQGFDALPDSVESLLSVQIDRVAPRDRTALRYAAVLGVNFPQDLLRASLEGERYALDDGVWERLEDYVRRDRSGIARFRHALVRDVAYEGLPFRRRKELHQRVGETIERLAAGTPDEQAELLSLHFFHAQRYDKAWHYSRIAGHAARNVYANVEAAGFFRRAIAAAGPSGQITDESLAEVHEALGDATDQLGSLDEAAEAYRAARRRLRGNPVREAQLLLKESWIPERRGRIPQALRLVTKGLNLLEGIDLPGAAGARARLATWYADCRARQGRFAEALPWCVRARREAEHAGDRDALAWAYIVLGWVETELGRPQGVDHLRAALAIYEELGNLSRQAVIYNNLGGEAYYAGRWNEALDLFERARELYARTGDAVGRADSTFNVGEILSNQGRVEEAEAHLLEAQRVWKAAGDRIGVALATSELGRVAYRAGKFDEAFDLLEAARPEFVEHGVLVEILETELRTSERLLLLGRSDEALAVAQRAFDGLKAIGEAAAIRVPRVLRLCGWAMLACGRATDARDTLERGLASARAARADYEAAMVLMGLAALEEDLDACTALLSESGALLERLGVREAPSVVLPALALS